MSALEANRRHSLEQKSSTPSTKDTIKFDAVPKQLDHRECVREGIIKTIVFINSKFAVFVQRGISSFV